MFTGRPLQVRSGELRPITSPTTSRRSLASADLRALKNGASSNCDKQNASSSPRSTLSRRRHIPAPMPPSARMQRVPGPAAQRNVTQLNPESPSVAVVPSPTRVEDTVAQLQMVVRNQTEELQRIQTEELARLRDEVRRKDEQLRQKDQLITTLLSQQTTLVNTVSNSNVSPSPHARATHAPYNRFGGLEPLPNTAVSPSQAQAPPPVSASVIRTPSKTKPPNEVHASGTSAMAPSPPQKANERSPIEQEAESRRMERQRKQQVMAAEVQRAESKELFSKSLRRGGQDALDLLSGLLKHCTDILDTLSTSSVDRKARKALLATLDRVELISLDIDLGWCDGLARCTQPDIDELCGFLYNVKNLRRGPQASSVQEAISGADTLVQCLQHRASAVVHATFVLGEMTSVPKKRVRALEVLRGLSPQRLATPSDDEVLAFDVAKECMREGDGRMSEYRQYTADERLSACMAVYTLACRNGEAVCASEELVEYIAGLWLGVMETASIGNDNLHLACAVLACVSLVHAEAPAKMNPVIRAALETQINKGARNAFVSMGKCFTTERVVEVAKLVRQRVLSASDTSDHIGSGADISVAAGGAYFVAFLLVSKPKAIADPAVQTIFPEALQLHYRIARSPLDSQYFLKTYNCVDVTSTRLTGVWFLLQHAKSLSGRAELPWWDSTLRGAIHMVEMNALAGLCSRDTMSFWVVLTALTVVEAAAKDTDAQREFLLKEDCANALEYACSHDFVFTGRSIASNAAGAMVALVGRNEGGHTLNRDTVRAVLRFLSLYFVADHPAFIRPAATIVLPLTTVATMSISDANKTLMLEDPDLISTLNSCLLLDKDNARRGQDGAEKMREVSMGIILQLALFGPASEQVRSHALCMESLRRLAKGGEEGTSKVTVEMAAKALFQLTNERGQNVRHKSIANVVMEASGGKINIESPAQQHLMMSYNWDHQSTVLRVTKSLKARGFHVWIDVESIEGSTVDSMAEGVENAAVMLIGVSRSYKESSNCRLEAQYGMQKKKPMIPLIVQAGYEADGWLGLMMGASLWYDLTGQTLTSETLFEDRMGALARELGDRGRAKTVSRAQHALLAMIERQRSQERSNKNGNDIATAQNMLNSADLEIAAEQHASDSIVPQAIRDAVDETVVGGANGLTQQEVLAVRAELQKMRVMALCKLAGDIGVEQEQMESAMDSADPKKALIEVLLRGNDEEHAFL